LRSVTITGDQKGRKKVHFIMPPFQVVIHKDFNYKEVVNECKVAALNFFYISPDLQLSFCTAEGALIPPFERFGNYLDAGVSLMNFTCDSERPLYFRFFLNAGRTNSLTISAILETDIILLPHAD